MSYKNARIFKLTIGKKLIFLIALLLCAAIGVLTHLSTSMFREDTEALVQQMTSDNARHLSESIRLEIETIAERARTSGFFMLQNPPKEVLKSNEKSEALAEIKEDKPNLLNSTREQYAKQVFEKDSSLYGIFLFESKADSSPQFKDALVFDPLLKLGESDGKSFAATLLSSNSGIFKKETENETFVTSLQTSDEKRVLAIINPFYKEEVSGKLYTLATVFSQNAWMDKFSVESFVSNFLIDQEGTVIVHPDSSLVNVRHNLSNLEIVKKVMEGKFTNGQTRYLDPTTNENKIGAFNLVGISHLAVVSEVPEKRAYESADRLRYRATLIALAILFVACGLGYVFSKSLTWPLNQLVSGTEKITAGDFTSRMKEKGSDEVSQLSKAFNKMAEGLLERDRVKQIFGKFHNKEVADKILSGEVKLGGEKKEAVIFFSDIRGFTAMSEQLTPEEIVIFLNEYMTQMVSVIRFHGGIVDKYIGDAIMALWGVPLSTGDDAGKAVRACLEMREKLAEFNAAREAAGKPVIYIGMGLNLGSVVAGNIGSEEKMEYTVIGDTVNTASRIESMTKELGTDLLVSQSIADKIQDRYLLEPCESVKVRGKAEGLSLYKVTGYKNGAGEIVKVETKYSSYAASKSDKSETEEPLPKAA